MCILCKHGFGLFSMCATSLGRPRIAQGGWMERSGQFREVLQYWRWEESWMTANMYQYMMLFCSRSSNPKQQTFAWKWLLNSWDPKNLVQIPKNLSLCPTFLPLLFLLPPNLRRNGWAVRFFGPRNIQGRLWFADLKVRDLSHGNVTQLYGDYKLQYISHYT